MAKKTDQKPKNPKLKASAWAVASSLMIAACPFTADAAGLGKVTVFSALGQPLRAEVEVFASREELAGMKAQLAAQDAYKQAGVDYSPSLAGIGFSIGKRANGQPVIRLSSDRAINDPFVDLLLELNWSAGRLVREYTFLLDPPEFAAKNATAPAITKPVVASRLPPEEKPVKTDRAEKADKTDHVRARPVRQAAKPAAEGGTTYEVKRGETLGKIANETRPEGVSLDQMLVGIFRANQEAFDRGNMNRLQAGKILTIPEKQALEAVPRDEARRSVLAQSSDWSGYRRKLAAGAVDAPVAEAAPARQQAAGKITAKIEDKAAPSVEPKDQLKVSKTEGPGSKSAAAKRSDEDLIAKEKALRDANERLASLEKNVAELQKLVELKSRTLAELEKQSTGKPTTGVEARKTEGDSRPPIPAVSPMPAAAPAPVAAPVVTPPLPPAAVPATNAVPLASTPVTPSVTTPAVVPKTAEPPAVEAAKPVEVAKQEDAKPAGPSPAELPKPVEPTKPVEKPKPKVVVAPPPEEPGFVEEMLTSTPFLAGGGVLAALGIAYGLARRRRLGEAERSLDATSTLGPPSDGLASNSVFRSAGGQSVDTSHSMMSQTDFSQAGPGSIDTDEVDPVAEADVYMAYGRDAQAEEILLEAKQKDPDRHAIHTKLLEIYLARGDVKPFDLTASELFDATGGVGPDWEKAAAMGRQLDPKNPMFGGPATVDPEPADAATTMLVRPEKLVDTVTRPGQLSQIAQEASAAAAIARFASDANEAPMTQESLAKDDLADLPFDLGDPLPEERDFGDTPRPEAAATVATPPLTSGPIDFDLASSFSTEPAVDTLDPQAAETDDEVTELAHDFDMPEVTMLIAPGTFAENGAAAKIDESGLGFEFDLTTDLPGKVSTSTQVMASAPTQVIAPTGLDDVLDIGSSDAPGLEFDVKLTESTVLGQHLQQSTFDMSSISLDLDDVVTPVSPLEGYALGSEHEDTLVNPVFADDEAETVVNPQLGEEPLSIEPEISSKEEVATKLDLAAAYHEMGDFEGARELLQEVLKDGDPAQREKASALIGKLRE